MSEKLYTFRDLLDWRGIETQCDRCSGSGRIVYGSTSTWRGGIGGQAMTGDVCNKCWGSGDEGHPWTNLKRVAAMQQSFIRISGEYLRI